jgi:hypothetical protein
MRTDAYCQRCLAAVRRGRTPQGTPLLLDPRLERDGLRWVLDYVDGTPIVAIAMDWDDIPANVVERYHEHICPDQL